MRKICVIPARMASSRFPGKPLEPILGMPMIQHIFRRCEIGEHFDNIIVATCDQSIKNSIEALGGTVVMTSDKHERCTDRVEEALRNSNLKLADDDFILMVQGDEIFVSPEMIQKAIHAYENEKPNVVNIATLLTEKKDCFDKNVVKVVCDQQDYAMYMSRSPLPSWERKSPETSFQQTGIIGFKKSFLHEYSNMNETPMEVIESIDMLRVLENRIPIKIIKVLEGTIGIDTPEELARVEAILKNDSFTNSYL